MQENRLHQGVCHGEMKLHTCSSAANRTGSKLFSDRRISPLWERYLGPTDVPLDHFTMKSDAVILNAVTAERMVAATQFWKNSGRSSECRHTVTHPDYYRHGLAMALIQAWLETTEKQGVCRWFTWISDKNSPSLALFHKMGFRQNGRISKQYILEKE